MTSDKVPSTLAKVFAVTIQMMDDNNHPYQHTESLWTSHLEAADVIDGARRNEKRRIVLRNLNVLSSGRVVWEDVETVWQSGRWVSLDHDPRAQDPQYREYLRLKEIYDNG